MTTYASTTTSTPSTTTVTASSTSGTSAPRPSGRPVAAVLLAAYALSIAYTIWSTVAGVAPAAFSARSPGAWAAYAVGLGFTALALKEGRGPRVAVSAWLVLSVAVALFAYPQAFTAQYQTPFGWFENDVYTGLLMVALDRHLRRRQ